MQTPWGELAVRDAHVHFFSHSFYTTLARQKGVSTADAVAGLGWELPDPDPVRLAAGWAAELDRHGVDRAALIASLPNDQNSVAAAIGAFPQRFTGFQMCDPTSPSAVADAERALESGMRCLCLFPAMHRYSVASDQAVSIIQLAADRPGTAVFVHCGVLSVGIRKKLGLPSPFDMRYSNPIDLHPVALRFGHVPFVIPHFGAGFLREALMLCSMCPNVHLDTSSTNGWTRLQSPPLSLVEALRQALEVAGPERLLFGTDSSYFPRGWHRQVLDLQIQALQEIGVPKSTAAAVLGGNFARLLT
ncbi:MAG TPA: amidohydrolase family protein [Bryobacteraceae bacterium]|nr:amidohydrolase family protein [Bryobacteraceae bacterium]